MILDEATSALDESTAKKLNTYDFGEDVIILCVAHRIESFLHYDRVLVLDAGKVAQIEPMASALQRKDAPFAQMLASQRRTNA